MAEPAPSPEHAPAAPAAGGRRTFGPVVLLGLAGGTLAAVGGSRPWAEAGDDGGAAALAGYALSDAGEMPAATAAALVVLACWGVVLVTRRRVRRGVAVLGAVAAVGLVAAVVVGWSATVDDVRALYDDTGTVPDIGRTAWFWASALGSVATLVASVLAVRLVPTWPEMGTRYDAPAGAAGAPAATVPPEDATNIDLWKAMDEGRDPTA
ncbi:Trp biosynthesis-associated membrane protein [Nocardioides sp. SOB77]|uniref:Trp biosynthesis-associated membrane protein n=1 Tax=Nocardioides oceani TaxID=3058369 RepID=A0ABT8FEN4_9ACTN|nr:Trp biosynthesis-associated membrane protein [Nocardioides oceani]MDN4173069.1 Trp biosynthesis-associated membrane protein [Nocardioides oceani]